MSLISGGSEKLQRRFLSFMFFLKQFKCYVFLCACRFPKKEDRRNKWIDFVRRAYHEVVGKSLRDENWTPSAGAVLCSKHFSREYFYEGEKSKRVRLQSKLKPDAIPTIEVFRLKFVRYDQMEMLREIPAPESLKQTSATSIKLDVKEEAGSPDEIIIKKESLHEPYFILEQQSADTNHQQKIESSIKN